MRKSGVFFSFLVLIPVLLFPYLACARALNSVTEMPYFLQQMGVSLETLGVYYFEANEDVTSAKYMLDREKGIIPGLRFYGQHVWRDGILTRLDLGLYKGELQYWGYLQDTTTGDIVGSAKNDAQHTWVNLSVDLGQYWPIRPHIGVIPYLQLGWWRWLRGVSPVSYVDGLGINGFYELYQHLYWGVGLRWLESLPNGWLRECHLSVGQSMNAKMRTSVPFVVSDSSVLLQDDYRLGHRTQIQVGLRFSYPIYSHWTTHMGIRYQYVNFASSAVNVVGVSEPQSHTNRLLFALGIASLGQ